MRWSRPTVRDKVKALVGALSDLPGGLSGAGGRMRCPNCASLDTQVKDSRPTEDSAAIRRRRVCLACNFRFTTFERVQLRELTVIKRNGRRVPFDRDKLDALGADRAAQARRSSRSASSRPSPRSCGSSRAGARARCRRRRSARLVMEQLRDARRRRLCALRLGLPQFPRGQGLRDGARRAAGDEEPPPGAGGRPQVAPRHADLAWRRKS